MKADEAQSATCDAEARTYRCMEVWGGNREVDGGVMMPGLDAWVYSRPHGGAEAGGDVHYMSSCATGRVIRVLVADVAGHGEQVARIAVRLRELMRRYMNWVDQSRLVGAMNGEFARMAEEGRFATAVVLTCWTPTDEVAVTRAGHPRPLLYRARQGRWSVVEDAGRDAEQLMNIPLGVYEPAGYDERRLRLKRGDMMLLYTDGVIEAADETGAQLGVEGLVSALEGLREVEAEALLVALAARVRERAGARGVQDDVTMLLVRTNEMKPRSSLWRGAAAGLRVAAGVAGSLVRGRGGPWPQMSVRNIVGACIGRLNGRGADEEGRAESSAREGM